MRKSSQSVCDGWKADGTLRLLFPRKKAGEWRLDWKHPTAKCVSLVLNAYTLTNSGNHQNMWIQNMSLSDDSTHKKCHRVRKIVEQKIFDFMKALLLEPNKGDKFRWGRRKAMCDQNIQEDFFDNRKKVVDSLARNDALS